MGEVRRGALGARDDAPVGKFVPCALFLGGAVAGVITCSGTQCAMVSVTGFGGGGLPKGWSGRYVTGPAAEKGAATATRETLEVTKSSILPTSGKGMAGRVSEKGEVTG